MYTLKFCTFPYIKTKVYTKQSVSRTKNLQAITMVIANTIFFFGLNVILHKYININKKHPKTSRYLFAAFFDRELIEQVLNVTMLLGGSVI